MTAGTGFPRLPEPGRRVLDLPRWHYPAWPGSPGGNGHLRVWETTSGHLAIVTDLDDGVSVTNAAEYIHRELTADYPGELVLIEHYPAGGHRRCPSWDQVTVTRGGQPEWRAIWPVPPVNPRYARCLQWVTAHGRTLGIPLPA